MNILIISTVIYSSGGDTRYQGIERLVSLWANELSKANKISAVAPSGSFFPRGIEHIEVPHGDFVQGEMVAYGIYAHRIGEFDLVLDFSHSHWAPRLHSLPSISWCWHDPGIMQPPLPSYNVATLSHWQRVRLWAYQNARAKVVDPHCGQVPAIQSGEFSDGFIFIGKISPTKGALEAVEICRDAGVPLTLIGQSGPGDPVEYVENLKSQCYGRINWLSNASDEIRIISTVSAKALIYPLNYPKNCGEAHSHKIVDALLCGCPVITYDVGAMREVIEHGVDGFLARNKEEFKKYMGLVGELDREGIKKRAEDKWSVDNVVKRNLPLLKEIAGGLRW